MYAVTLIDWTFQSASEINMWGRRESGGDAGEKRYRFCQPGLFVRVIDR